MNFLFPKDQDSDPETESDCIYDDGEIYIQFHSNREVDLFQRFQNWSKNRPPDWTRVEDIKEYYTLNHRTIMDGFIYVWASPLSQICFIYDGIHRLESLKQISHEVFFQVFYYTTSRENDIIQHFQALNKSVNIPTLYLDKHINYYKKDVCESIVKELCSLYPYFVSASRKPHYYNFNRDNLIEQFASLSIDFQVSHLVPNLLLWLQDLNMKSKRLHLHDRNTPAKCHKYNFYLFLMDWKDIQVDLEKRFQSVYHSS